MNEIINKKKKIRTAGTVCIQKINYVVINQFIPKDVHSESIRDKSNKIYERGQITVL